MSAQSQFTLLGQQRFLPFFITQFLGAFNDNVFRNALIILIAFQGAEQAAGDARYLVNISAALFILPFFLFSSTAGQIGDSYEKSALIRKIKLAEIMIMLLATVGFLMNSLPLLMLVLFLMGTQSSVFGPLKYGYLPQHLETSELTGGNGLMGMGTFMAILAGMIIGSHLMTYDNGAVWVSILVLLIAVAGYIGARSIPSTPAVQPELNISWNVFSQTWKILQLTGKNRTVFLSVLGISWFWFIGSTYMVQLPNYTREILGADESVYILLLALFCIGISVGSVFCEKLSAHKVETGLVPLGAIGLTVFGVDLFFATPNSISPGALLNIGEFMQQPGSWHCLIDIVLVGVFGGFYIVPLFAVIQERAQKDILSRIIAGNNVLNALFMVVAAMFAILLLGTFSMTEDKLFLVMAIMNAIVTGIIFILVPEFMQRFQRWLKKLVAL